MPKMMFCQESSLLGEHDVCLSNVDALHLMGDKKRRLLPGKNMSDKVKGLIVVCKNMKVMSFSFKFSPLGHGRNLTNALLHHAFPKRHQLLFAYDFREPYYSCPLDVLMFHDPGDWGRELARTEAVGWRLTSVNKEFKMSASLPEWIVVPSSATDSQLLEAARHFPRRTTSAVVLELPSRGSPRPHVRHSAFPHRQEECGCHGRV